LNASILSDSLNATSDDVTVIVNPAAAANQAPTVNAGNDRALLCRVA
jgi:hypothetical protein